MIPIKLSIEGLYSYQTRQTIDFAELTETGLFGVFGAVGSGKSSILEAITFALYGNSDRLGAKDYAYNMMNLKSNRLWIEFEFLNFENKTFKVVREYKRNGKNFDKVLLTDAVLYEQIEGQWIPKESNSVEEIIGLSSENFRRTIIIPQGQFREFIELKPTARTQMMKEIFNLHQYDLQYNTSELVRQNKTSVDQLEGQLKGFEAVSEEEIQAIKEKQAEAKAIQDAKQAEFNDVNERFTRLKALKSQIEEWKSKQLELEQLELRRPDFESLEKEVNQFEQIQRVFFARLQERNRTQSLLKEKEANKKLEQEQLVQIEADALVLDQDVKRLQPLFEGLENRKAEERDWQLLAKITDVHQVIGELEERLVNGQAFLNLQKQSETTLQTDIQTIEKEMESFAQQLMFTSDLMAIEAWYLKQTELNNRIEVQTTSLQEKQDKAPTLEAYLTSLGWDVDGFEQKIIAQQETIFSTKKQLEEKRQELLLKQQFAHFTHNLKDGHECPLCGSLDHPRVADTEDNQEMMQEANLEWERILREEEQLKAIISQIEKIEYEVKLYQERLVEENQALLDTQKQLEELNIHFKWTEFDPSNRSLFETKKAQHLQVEQQKVVLENQLKEKRTASLSVQQKVEQAQQKMADLNAKTEAARREKETLVNALTQLNWNDFASISKEEIHAKANALSFEIQQIEQDYHTALQKLNTLNITLGAKKATLEGLQKQVEELYLHLTTQNAEIAGCLEKEKMASEADVWAILDKNISVAEKRSEINQFQVQFKSTQISVEDFKRKLDGIEWDDNQMDKETILFQQADEALKLATEMSVKLTADKERLEKQFEEKRELMNQFTQLKRREENLATLSKLFKGAGFVEYVATIYLKQLCDHANQRFHRMTRNQLSLQMNNSGFEIIDYLNGGKSRSVKTLSGGQAFQVSLCLALALAESVQASSKANRNFFFIDEGFGTQDTESVNIVFETLMNLQKENRIVGIISHVEELKERMPIAIQVEKDVEIGSIIEIIK